MKKIKNHTQLQCRKKRKLIFFKVYVQKYTYSIHIQILIKNKKLVIEK